MPQHGINKRSFHPPLHDRSLSFFVFSQHTHARALRCSGLKACWCSHSLTTLICIFMCFCAPRGSHQHRACCRAKLTDGASQCCEKGSRGHCVWIFACRFWHLEQPLCSYHRTRQSACSNKGYSFSQWLLSRFVCNKKLLTFLLKQKCVVILFRFFEALLTVLSFRLIQKLWQWHLIFFRRNTVIFRS